ncbi:MAG: GNAT family N-acetyltransferase [Rhizobiaceae bacterium]|nr:GNAT family N-acetyltransferase [Hyphomicrobiales bacterium]NRB31247.1 GNAT family N-acetyltransferase [Rhizobiaceae bacterium]
MTGISLRKATLQDVPDIVACIDAAYARYRDKIADLPPVSDGVEEDIRDNQVWVIETDGDLAGVLVLVAASGADFIKLANVAVHPDHGGKGLGRALIDHAIATCKDQGFDEIRLNTHAAMTDNIGLYQHLGWHEIGRSETTVSMSRKI